MHMPMDHGVLPGTRARGATLACCAAGLERALGVVVLTYRRAYLQTLDAKKEWNTHFEAYIRELDTKKPVVWTGDLNVAPTAIGAYWIRFLCLGVWSYETP